MQNDSTTETLNNPGPEYIQELKIWLANLLETDVDAMANEVAARIKTIDQARLVPAMHMEVLDLLEPKVSYVARNLERRYLGATMPPTQSQLSAAMFSQTLQLRFGESYGACAFDLKETASPPAFAAEALVKALYHCDNALYESYLVYQSETEGFWGKVHQLYLTAERFKVQDELAPTDRSKQLLLTPRIAYQQLLLLHLASPWQMHQNQVRQLKEQLPRWARHCQISDQTSSKQICQFVLRGGRQSLPTAISSDEYALTPNDRILDTSALIQVLNKQYLELKSNKNPQLSGGSPELSHEFVRQLIRAWSAPRKRHYARRYLDADMYVALGIPAIHQVLSLKGENKWKELEHQIEAREKGERLELEEGVPTIDHPSRLIPLQDNVDILQRQEKVSIWEEQDTLNALYRPLTFRALDQSAGGFCVRWNGQTSSRPELYVGELMAVGLDGSSGSIGIAMVRWMRVVAQEGLRLGLQLISPHAEPVTLLKTEGGRVTKQVKALLLPELGVIDQQEQILAPPMSCRRGDSLRLQDQQGQQRSVLLTRSKDIASSYQQFEFIEVSRSSIPDLVPTSLNDQ
jgi:hypothetical protein